MHAQLQQVLPTLVTTLVTRQLGKEGNTLHYTLRQWAAALLAAILDRWCPLPSLQCIPLCGFRGVRSPSLCPVRVAWYCTAMVVVVLLLLSD